MTSQAASQEDARRTAGQRDLDKRCIDTIRTLAIDAVEKANSGHAGTPMATFDRSRYAAADGLARGAYIMAGASDRTPAVILMASGSEVQLCISAYERLTQEGIAARVVSVPSWELLEAQDRYYREEVLPPKVKARVTVEPGAVIGWDRYAGPEGTIIGMHPFGGSAAGTGLMRKFGFVADTIL
jgi:transketolase